MNKCLTKLAPSILLLLLLVGYFRIASGQDYLALITESMGDVLVSRAPGGAFQTSTWGVRLSEGDRVRTLNNSSVSILYSSQDMVRLGPNSEHTVSNSIDYSDPIVNPARAVSREVLAQAANLALHRTSDGDVAALGGLRNGSSPDIELITPRNTKIQNASPKFVWSSKRPFDRYLVSLLDSNGLVWSGETSEHSLSYPDDAPSLSQGKPYFWQVEGEVLLETAKTPVVLFEILSNEAETILESRKSELESTLDADSSSTNALFMLGSLYAADGLLAAAIDAFETIVQRYPDSSLAHEILGSLYADVGLKDHAIKALQEAISLREQ